MALNIKLKAHEVIIINGCIARNGPRRTSLKIENFANVIRESDLIARDQVRSPVSAIYYAVQSIITNPSIAEKSLKEVQGTLAKLHGLLPEDGARAAVMEAANHISAFNFYQALNAIKSLMEREQELFPESFSEKN